jgi:hypothetical protein
VRPHPRRRAALVVTALGVIALAAGAGAQDPGTLRGPDAFVSIGDRAQRSMALFTEAAKVFQHPRCQNCHPGDDRPRQGNEGRPHSPTVQHGVDGMGAAGLRCPACHGEANFDAVGMPGMTGWHLAPAAMGLRGRSVGRICAQVKDPSQNGSRELADIVSHAEQDRLIAWAWTPGTGRRPAPGTHGTFAALMRAWAETGAECPPG